MNVYNNIMFKIISLVAVAVVVVAVVIIVCFH